MTCGSIQLTVDLFLSGYAHVLTQDVVVYFVQHCQLLA